MTSVSSDRRQGLNSSAALKVPVRVATTAAITLSGLQTIDGVALASGDRVLVKDQASGVNNGIYVADTGNWTRDLDFDGVYDALQGTMVYVDQGSTLAQSVYLVSTANPITIGTTSLTFVKGLFSAGGTASYIHAGTGQPVTTLQTQLDTYTGAGAGAYFATNTASGISALASTTTGDSNTAYGHSALTANTTGQNNVAIGRSSLPANTIGVNNVAMGTNALMAAVSDNDNTAVGQIALTACNGGSNNTAIGSSALGANTTASNNTAVGKDAMRLTTTGDLNTAVGRDALYTNLTGANNVSVGALSLFANTASDNTAIGCNALKANTSGTSNVAVGKDALLVATTGSGHTAVGAGALQGNTTGVQNTAVGEGTFTDVTTGGSNTAVGYNTGRGITTGSNNTIIGAQVTGLAAGLANTVIIAIGDGTARLTIDSNWNTILGPMTAPATLQNGVLIPNGTAPTASPVGGGVLYVLAGVLRYRGPGGTDSLLAAS